MQRCIYVWNQYEPRDLFRLDAFPQDKELIPSHPGDEVIAAFAYLTEQLRKPDQRVVAGFMPVPVIDLLDVIQIQHHREELMVFLRSFSFL